MARGPIPLVGSLDDLLRYEHRLRINCLSCQHSAEVNINALAAANGRDYRVQAMIERAKCKKCGARWPKLSVTVIPPSLYKSEPTAE